MYGGETVNTCALCRSFISSSSVSGGIIVFLCFILYDVTGDRFKLNMSQQMVLYNLLIINSGKLNLIKQFTTSFYGV